MRYWIGLGLALGLAGCMEYNVGKDGDDVFDPDTDTDGHTDKDTDIEPKEEICNGEDDDGDGEIDEGFSDLDGDGIADCVDETCEVEEGHQQEIDVLEECTGGAGSITDPWDVTIEWQWSSSSGPTDSAVPPLVANITDTNGDGRIDVADTPNVLQVSFQMISSTQFAGTLYVLEGDTGKVVWSKANLHGLASHAVADVTGDGVPDIATHTQQGCPTLLDASGGTIWTSSHCTVDFYPQSVVADLKGDGSPEIITNEGIFDGATGSRIAALSRNASIPYTSPAVGDIDLDGEQEIVLGNTVLSADGSVEWSVSQIGNYGHWAAIVNADSDPEAEVVMVGNDYSTGFGMLAVYEHDGTVKWSSNAGGTGASPMCAADFDGDGETEVAWASQGTFHVYDLDGTEVWNTSVTDFSGLSGCSGYDVDGDLAYEVLYADEGAFYLFDGKTGAVNYTNTSHSSATLFEYPTIADVDGDGSAEILYVSNFFLSGAGSHGLTVLGHDGDGWAKSGPAWPVFDFAVTNINQDASVPAIPLYWQDYNVYRARPVVDNIGVDLGVIISDVCFTGCMLDSIVKVAVQVGNQGEEDAEANIAVTLYAVDGAELTPIETKLIPTVVPSGTLLPGIVFEITAEFVGPDGFLVRVDDDGTGAGKVIECDEENNEDVWTDNPCP